MNKRTALLVGICLLSACLAGIVGVLCIRAKSGEPELQKMVVVRMELLRYARQYGAYPDALKQLETEGVLPPGFTEGLEDMYVAAGQPYRKETASPQLLLRQMKYRPYERVFISGQARAFVYSSMDPVLIPRRQQYFYWDVRRGVERTNILLEHGLDPDIKSKLWGDWEIRRPLYRAIAGGYTEVARLLLDAGADPSLCKPKLAILFALSGDHFDAAELLFHRAKEYLSNPREIRAEIAVAKGDISLVKDLVKKNPGLIESPPGESSLLHKAAQHGQKEIVKELLKRGADPNAKDVLGETPVFCAASHGHFETARLLLRRGGKSSLEIAAARGDLSKVKKFLAGAGEPEHKVAPSEDSPNQVEGKGKKSLRQLESALGLAVRHGHARVVRLFFEEGDFRGHYHYRAFLAAAASGNHLETARVLIEEGAEVNGINQLGYPGPFYWAVIRSDPELVKLFIESGADVDRGAAGRGITFLHKAATIGRTAVVRMLLDSGANPNAKATEKCSLECVNQTPLHCAAEKGHLETAKLLVSWGAKTDAEDALGWTPLEEAAFGGHREVYDFLKEVTVKKRGSGSEHIN